MKLQAAFDGTLEQSLSIARAVRPYIDIAEIGTPLIFREGMSAVRALREAFPDLMLLVDLKIMDAGKPEAAIAFEAGGDLVTVLGVTQDKTILGALEAASQFNARVMVDLMQVFDPLPRSRHLLDLGCHYLCVHTAYDLQSADTTPLRDLAQLRAALPQAPLAVAGGIDQNSIGALQAFAPDIVIVGSAITNAPDPARAARAIRERMDRR